MDAEVSALEDHLGYWLRMVSNAVSHEFARKVTAEGVTVAEWVFLRSLYRQDGVAPTVLADRMGMTRGAISKLGDRLLAKGLVARKDNAGRGQVLTLTAQGRALVPILARLADRNDAEFFAALPAQDRDTLERLLKLLVERRGLSASPSTDLRPETPQLYKEILAMDANRIAIAETCLKAAHDGSLAFPQIVARLIGAGFEGYAVDYRRGSQTYYLPDGDSATFDLPAYSGPVAAAFDAAEVARLVRWAQSNPPGYSYVGFSEGAKAAGCAGYLVSFPGRRVVYYGRSAETQVELFPN